jgi:biopolymer transport protein ExbB
MVLAQIEAHGWLTSRLLGATLSSAEWVLWLLLGLSVISLAIVLERLVYFAGRRLQGGEALAGKIARGDLDVARAAAGGSGMEAAVLASGLEAMHRGADTVEQVIAATVAQERPRYERGLSVLGTLGNNAPFVGLFGTVLGVIRAFHDLGVTGAKGAAIQQTVMTGISEALVATAAGLAVAIPAVVAYNGFTRWLKNITARTNAIGHALVATARAHPELTPVRKVAEDR